MRAAANAGSLAVLAVASEMYPLIKTGGLADVVGALPAALRAERVDVTTLLPGYPAVMDAVREGSVVADWSDWFGGSARLVASRHADADLLVLDAPHLYARPGNPYLDETGRDWSDNAERFASLSFAAARIGRGDVDAVLPDVIHVHDWQAALVPACLRHVGVGRVAPATVLTIHNLAFQGQFDARVLDRIGFPESAFVAEALEYFGDIGYLKAGILMADAITTVSPTYAREIRTTADGMGMDAMLRWRGGAVSGILNGIDTGVWDPATDPLLANNYDATSLASRSSNKRTVEARFGMPEDDGPLFCMVTRLTTQKGVDLVVDRIDALIATGARFAILGSGDAALEQALDAAASRHRGRLAIQVGYDEALSHRMQGGCDAILIPSRFEPCGLTQLYGLRYGCVPVVSRVGGLADTVIDANEAALKAGVATGIQFADVSGDGVVEAVQTAVDLHARPMIWQRMQAAGMRDDVGWEGSARAYAALYRRLVEAR